jgi:hypothetical protein
MLSRREQLRLLFQRARLNHGLYVSAIDLDGLKIANRMG